MPFFPFVIFFVHFFLFTAFFCAACNSFVHVVMYALLWSVGYWSSNASLLMVEALHHEDSTGECWGHVYMKHQMVLHTQWPFYRSSSIIKCLTKVILAFGAENTWSTQGVTVFFLLMKLESWKKHLPYRVPQASVLGPLDRSIGRGSEKA